MRLGTKKMGDTERMKNITRCIKWGLEKDCLKDADKCYIYKWSTHWVENCLKRKELKKKNLLLKLWGQKISGR